MCVGGGARFILTLTVDTVVVHGITEPFQMMSYRLCLEEIKAMEASSLMFSS